MTFLPSFYELSLYAISFFVYSFGGWIFEVLISIYQHHRFVNRGFVLGPVLPIYGVGALAAIILLGPLSNPAVQLVVGCAFAAVLEYGTSWAMEKLFHARWWDYSDKPLNLNGRICAPGILLFGLLMLAVLHLAQPALESIITPIPHDLLEFIASVMCIGFAADLAASIMRMKEFTERLDMLQARLGELAEEARTRTEEAKILVQDVVDDTRDALVDAREALGEAMDDARESLSDAGRRTYERVTDAMDEGKSRVTEAAAAQRDALEARVRDLLGQLPRPSLLERRTMDNPYFKPLTSRDAFDWAKTRLGKKDKDKK